MSGKYLEYIEGTGTQYIDTGIVPNANTKVVCEFEHIDNISGYDYLFGCDQFSGYYYGAWYAYYSESGDKVNFKGTPVEGKHVFTKQMLTANIDGKYDVTTTAGNPTLTMYIFARHAADGYKSGKARIYSFKIYSGSTLIKDYRPAKDPSGVVCMYDEVAGEYVYNAGTGAFVAGPETGDISGSEPQPPAAPTNLRATVDGTTVTLTWDAMAFATQYIVYKDSSSIATVTETSYTCTVAAGATYRFGVRSMGDAGYSGVTQIYVEVSAEITPPAAPSNFRATLSGTTATLRWDAVSGADGYKLYRDGTLIATQAGTSYTDYLEVGRTYQYTLRAYNDAGESGVVTASVTVPLPAPDAPGGFTATVNGATATLTWDASARADGYRLYRDGALISTQTGTSFRETLGEGQTYTYTLIAYNGAGYSPQATTMVTIPKLSPDAPGGFTASVDGAKVTLTWTPTARADGYRLYRDDALISTQTGTGFTDTVTTGAVYRYSLTAYNTYGVSAAVSLSVNVPYVAPSLELITDRTQSDVDRVKYLTGLWDPEKGWTGTPEELAEWMGGLKGTYNATDLNRVGAAVQYLAGRLTGYGYLIHAAPKTDWGMSDIPTPAQLTAYLADVAELRGALAVLPETPEVPADMIGLTWREANDIEKILEDVEQVVNIMITTFIPCGEAICGGDNL